MLQGQLGDIRIKRIIEWDGPNFDPLIFFLRRHRRLRAASERARSGFWDSVEFEVHMPATGDIARGQIDRALGRTQFDDERQKARTTIEADRLTILEAHRVGDEFVMQAKTDLVQARSS